MEDSKKQLIDFVQSLRRMELFDRRGIPVILRTYEQIDNLVEYLLTSVKFDKDTCKKLFYMIPEEDDIREIVNVKYETKLRTCVTLETKKQISKKDFYEVCFEHLYQALANALDNPKIIDDLGNLIDRTTVEILSTEQMKARNEKDAEALEHMRKLKTFCEARGNCDGCPFHAKDNMDAGCIIGSPNVWSKEHALEEAAEERYNIDESLRNERY